MTIDHALLDILACPEDKGPLFYIESESLLYNPRLTRSYPVVKGIPVMLIEESTQVSESEHTRLQALIAAEGIKPTFTR
ncbi:MAG: hypothetical protein RLY19_201 [Actinomycetota bacterium]|jgi:uncharacterized protein YbaR (Trm112 family)